MDSASVAEELRACDAELKQSPADPRLNARKGSLLLARSEEFPVQSSLRLKLELLDQANRHYDAAVSRDPQSPEAILGRVRVRLEVGRLMKYQAYARGLVLGEAIAASGAPGPAQLAEREAQRAGDGALRRELQDAVDLAREAVRILNTPEASLALCRTLEALGTWFGPSPPSLEKSLEYLDEAVALLGRADVVTRPSEILERKALLERFAGELRIRLGQPEEAFALFQRAAEDFTRLAEAIPDHPAALVYYAEVVSRAADCDPSFRDR